MKAVVIVLQRWDQGITGTLTYNSDYSLYISGGYRVYWAMMMLKSNF